jgi:hypothetical protein
MYTGVPDLQGSDIIYNIPDCMWTTAASLHMDDNAAKWWQVYKLKAGLGDWDTFVRAVEEKFGAYDYRKVVQDLLALRQEGVLGLTGYYQNL